MKQIVADDPVWADAIRHLLVDLLREGYWIRSPARAASMSPFIRRGDILTVRPATFAEIGIGDIIAYRRKETESVLTTHRVIQKGEAREGPYLITKGDACRYRNLPITCPTQVVGKVVHRERAGRILSLEAPFQRLLGYLTALFSVGAWHFKNALAAPHQIPAKVARRISNV